MRIAVVCTDPGIPVFGSKGASIHLQSVLEVFLARGYEVHLVAVRPAGSRAGVTVHPLPKVAGEGLAARELSAMAADRAVAGVLDGILPDLVYERYALWGRTATDWALRHGVPSVLEVNAPLVAEQRTHRGLHHEAEADAVAHVAVTAADTVVCVSRPVADWVLGLGADEERVLVEPNGVDTDRIRPRTGLPTETDCTVGFLGTLKPWHGVEVLTEAVARLHRQEPGWRLLIVGDGPHRDVIADSAAARSLGGALELTGAVPADGVAAQLHRFDIAAAPYPATADTYFSPLKVYEYLAAGLPVVASAVGQLPQALDHGRLGELVPAGDPVALAQALSRLRDDPRRRHRLAIAGRARAVGRHTWDGVVGRVLDHAGRAA